MNEQARQSVSESAPARKAVLIGPARRRPHGYVRNHPLFSIPRVSLAIDLIESYGALLPREYLDARRATPAELLWFHTRDYVGAMQRCEALERVSEGDRRRHNIGNYENPYFPGFFAIPATATGGSIQGAEQVLAGNVAFSPAGGMHHGMPDQARGFCYFNDPALAVMRLRREGLRVLYLDIDAHHGDGVEYAFRADPGVVTLSLHMDTAYAYPFQGGGRESCGTLGNAVNFPLPKAVNDTEYRHAFTRLWPAVLEAFRPQALVLQAGTDMLRPDPLGKFNVSTQMFLEVVQRVVEEGPAHADGTPRLLVLGGGGYHPLALARCWAGVWGILSGRRLPVEIPAAGQALLRAVDWDQDEDAEYFQNLFVRRLDEAQEGEIRPEIEAAVAGLLDQHPLFASS